MSCGNTTGEEMISEEARIQACLDATVIQHTMSAALQAIVISVFSAVTMQFGNSARRKYCVPPFAKSAKGGGDHR
jgi:hypothetical protein